jgi:hypothetical protein
VRDFPSIRWSFRELFSGVLVPSIPKARNPAKNSDRFTLKEIMQSKSLDQMYAPLIPQDGKSTAGVKSAAIALFEKFLVEIGEPSFNELKEDDLCCETIYQRFGQYLVQGALKSNGERYSVGGSLDYLSAVKTMAQRRYPQPQSDFWSLNDWYSTLRDCLEDTLSDICINEGRSISEKNKPIGRSMVKSMVQTLISMNSPSGFLQRLVFVWTFLAVGRVSEIAKSSWNTAAFIQIEEESLFLDWSDSKNSKKRS